jgi:hypothetical protein
MTWVGFPVSGFWNAQENGSRKPETRPGLSEPYQGPFRQGGFHLVQTMRYEAYDVKEADDQ